jgi:hypothetical protein
LAGGAKPLATGRSPAEVSKRTPAYTLTVTVVSLYDRLSIINWRTEGTL